MFGDLLLDEMQLEMVSVGAALKEAGCEIEVKMKNGNLDLLIPRVFSFFFFVFVKFSELLF